MSSNYLEQLSAEWYEFNGYFVRRNILVGRLHKGGYECELDIVAFNPQKKHLVHIEPSMDANSWAERERRFKKKFNAGKKHIPNLFNGFKLPSHIEQIALLGFAGKKHPSYIGGGKVVVISEFLGIILKGIWSKSSSYSIIPEQYPMLRTLQLVTDYPNDVINVIKK